MAVTMAMYGALFFIPIYAQGVIGASATSSGAMLMPLMFSAVALSVLVGRLITRTGRYKGFVLAGLIVMGAGYYLLTRLGYGSTQADLTVVMVVLGLGAVMQTYILIVQNATHREDLGVATSITQLTRSIGATLGPAIFGTVMAGRMKSEISKHLPSQALNDPQVEQFSGESGVGSLPDPNALGQLPPAVETGLREGLAAALHSVFLVGLAIIGIALVTSIFIRELPLRDTAFADEDVGKQILDEPSRSAANGAYASDRRDERQKP
jgi:MFS family permease